MQLFYLFFYSCSLCILLHPLIGITPPVSFAPFLSICFYRTTPIGALWWALSCGLIADLFSYDAVIGTNALIYCLISFFLYGYKFHFFEDRISTLPVLSFGFTFLSNLLKLTIFYILGKPFSISWGWIGRVFFTDSLLAGLYALFAFTLPLIFFLTLKRRLFLRSKGRRF